MTTHTVVVFDLGNVLIGWDRALLFSKLIDDADELEHFLSEVYSLEANQELDRGVPLADVVAALSAQHPKYQTVLEAFGHRWIETIAGAIDGSVEILEELNSRWTPLYALSNWGAETFAIVEHEFPFFGLFDGLVISGREGVVKPDRAIFDLMCERHGFRPAEALFIDDSETNIDAAHALGFDTILFAEPEQLRIELETRNLL
jgi:2-haloacid dehalogenase